MGNLGLYQTITTIAKKLGGPDKLPCYVAVGGYVVIRMGEEGVRYCIRRTKASKQKKEAGTEETLLVVKDYHGSHGDSLKKGELIRLINVDGDAALIVKNNDSDNPLFISFEQLKKVTIEQNQAD